jgi:hypothetical protein
MMGKLLEEVRGRREEWKLLLNYYCIKLGKRNLCYTAICNHMSCGSCASAKEITDDQLLLVLLPKNIVEHPLPDGANRSLVLVTELVNELTCALAHGFRQCCQYFN